ncbi:ATP-dependent DNA helicase RecG [soil metagenome]
MIANPLTLDQLSCASLKGVGKAISDKLRKCGVETVQDLLFHLPLHYQDRTHITAIADLRVGEHAVIEGRIEFVDHLQRRRPILLCRVRDSSGSIDLCFFHFTLQQMQSLVQGTTLRCFGEVRHGFAHLEMVHPEYRQIYTDKPVAIAETLTPIYPTTEGLHQYSWRNLTAQALALMQSEGCLPECFPAELLQQFKLPSLQNALRYVHRPPADAAVALLETGKHPAQQRLAFEELLAHNLSLRRLRLRTQHHRAPTLFSTDELSQRFLNNLSFTLTQAQQRVIKEISIDLALEKPMQRLVQGDVGSGKTAVAAMALLQALESGYQVALMAPTELLAEQHFQNMTKWFEPLGLSVVWLTGRLKGKAKTTTLQAIATGEVRVVIGTHALFQAGVNFAKLGLIVVDEQHRFGVEQRRALREKGEQNGFYPHQLILTATPIPRTLAMTAYADLDVSVIDEMPPGRTPIKTVAIAQHRREEVVGRIHHAGGEQRQIYWVCTLIDESEVLQCQAAETTTLELQQLLPHLRIGLIHGRLKATDKEQIMAAFKAAELDVLVATTVIEVGVDVPNASLMIIENPERLGLAQLHQLRGRVGRGAKESVCVLLYKSPLSEMAAARLQALRETQDGFAIAKKDLELRGPGEVLGTRQTGLLQLKIADLHRDQHLLPDVVTAGELLLRDYPHSVDLLIRRWISGGEQYGAVG